MFGFVIGLACLFGLARVIRGGRRGWGHGWHGRRWHGGCGSSGDCGPGGHGPGGWEHDDHDHGHGHGWRGRARWGFMRGIFERLDTTPGQEKVVKSAFDEVRKAAEGVKDDLVSARGDVAKAFRSEAFDESIAGDLLSRHDAKMDELRKTLVGALAKVHGALDPEQRERLARFLENGPRRWGGPYRV
jgi:Spy/CpxP family protein refolding chaperone